MAKNKYLDTTAYEMISNMQQEQKQSEKEQREIKTHRIQLIVRPSIYEGIKKIAVMQRKTLNAYIGELLEAELGKPENQQLIDKYNEVF